MNVARRRKQKARRRAERSYPRPRRDFVLDLDAFNREMAAIIDDVARYTQRGAP